MRLMEASRTATKDKPTIIPIKMTDCSESKTKMKIRIIFEYIKVGHVTDALIIRVIHVFLILSKEYFKAC